MALRKQLAVSGFAMGMVDAYQVTKLIDVEDPCSVDNKKKYINGLFKQAHWNDASWWPGRVMRDDSVDMLPDFRQGLERCLQINKGQPSQCVLSDNSRFNNQRDIQRKNFCEAMRRVKGNWNWKWCVRKVEDKNMGEKLFGQDFKACIEKSPNKQSECVSVEGFCDAITKAQPEYDYDGCVKKVTPVEMWRGFHQELIQCIEHSVSDSHSINKESECVSVEGFCNAITKGQPEYEKCVKDQAVGVLFKIRRIAEKKDAFELAEKKCAKIGKNQIPYRAVLGSVYSPTDRIQTDPRLLERIIKTYIADARMIEVAGAWGVM